MSTVQYKFPFSANAVDISAFNAKMMAKYHSEFAMCTIDVGSSLDPLLIDTDAICRDHRIVDLDFLEGMRSLDEEAFLPNKLYVRDNMRKIFGLYVNDSFPPNKRRTVLVGSPGVGKSILFFLAAIYRVYKQSNEQKWATIYFRRTRAEDISVFIMVPHTDTNHVHVIFTRTLDVRQVGPGGISNLSLFLEASLGIQRNQYFAFVDGPRYDEREDTMNGFYDFFCTSGGHPPFKSHQYKTCRLWILNGWSEEESIAGFSAVFGNRDNEESTKKAELTRNAKEAYWLCGGSIRNQIEAFNDDIEEAKKRLIAVIHALTKDVLVNILHSSKSTNEESIPNGLRTMFRRDNDSRSDKLMIALQIVDSQYILEILIDKLDMDKFLSSYNEANVLNVSAIQGYYFEFIIHKYFTGKKCRGISVCFAAGSSIIEDVKMFKETNMYWIPGIKNFPVIDSAVVIDNVLHAFQMTVSLNHKKFDKAKFKKTLLVPVMKMQEVSKVIIYLVTPNDVHPDMSKYQENDKAVRSSDRLNGIKLKIDEYIYEHVPINMQDVETICSSIKQMMEKIIKK